jgi:transposase-like protein
MIHLLEQTLGDDKHESMAYIPLNQIVDDALDELDAQQKQKLLGILQDTTTPTYTKAETTLSNMEEIRRARFHAGLICPQCKVHCKFKKNGTYRSNQRYLCKLCDRYFTSTPLHRTKYPGNGPLICKQWSKGFHFADVLKKLGLHCQLHLNGDIKSYIRYQ